MPMRRVAWIAGASGLGGILVLAAVNLAALRRGGEGDPIFRNGTIV